ncbi:glycogen synthase GlgA [Dendrosporobacter sp. 1207_IL3150]|uniref:glycogen synthase GlgA n=1 Tax=Dendrosporobacter sp. 1207_IL3150 TaxID=3084054 RepID=UPI002FD96F78
MLKVLFVAAEAVPFIKTGGLADVAGSLPKQLRAEGVDVRVIIPKYSGIPTQYREQMTSIHQTTVSVGWRQQYCGVEKLEYDGVPFYFIHNEDYFKRNGLYGYDDDAERYAFFCRAVLDVLPNLDFIPDVIHCNDWHTGMVSVFLEAHYRSRQEYQNIRTMFTIHNLRYQGVFPKEIMPDLLSLGWEYFNIEGLEFYNQVSYMKGGLVFSDIITTVSSTYAEEIQYEYFGEKLDGLLRKRRADIVGIVNGIDNDLYNPATDPHIPINFDANSLDLKWENKVRLQERLGLPVKRSTPLIAIVSRLVAPKGLDLIAHIIDELIAGEDIQLVVLGTGEECFESLFQQAAWKYPNKVSANICFDEALAHQVYAASDIFLMPSQYEPCGIGQLIALRYGALPVVRETGGLKDTIMPYNKYTGEGNGFSFESYNAHDLLFTVKKALGLFYDKPIWSKIVQNAMQSDYSWRQSAQQYKAIYTSLHNNGG